ILPRLLARNAASVQYRMIAAVNCWPPENTSRISETRCRSVRSTESGLSMSTRNPFGTAARTPRSTSDMPSRLTSRPSPVLPARAQRGGPLPRTGRQVVPADRDDLLAHRAGKPLEPLFGGVLGQRVRARPDAFACLVHGRVGLGERGVQLAIARLRGFHVAVE